MAETRTGWWVMVITVLKMVAGLFLGLAAAVVLVILGLGMLFREYRRIESLDD
jgi:hypothetical protein